MIKLVLFLLGDSKEELGKLIQNYIREIEELRYGVHVLLLFVQG